jgi:selenocysteine-specific elongation factor
MSEGASRLVLGTAGHIDHGKTALVRALTGVDCDRLPEEKARGITIELGFAPLDLPDGTRLSVVDVPGHEKLVRTMVAGAAGIDLMLLVVAADEGVMPQTREHTAICELLALSRGVVALTKIDLADEETALLAEDEVRELLAGGPLAGLPIVPVSAATGRGVEALRDEIARAAATADARTPRRGPARLGIDRAFTMRGFGTVVTGTLVGGALRVGDTVELLPAGRRARVRGLQSHGVPVETAAAGVRTAVNLQGVDLAEVRRGDLLAAADALLPTHVFDASLHWLSVAPPLAERTSVELLAGTAERRALVSPIGAVLLAPGGNGPARVHVQGEPLALLPGDRFVVRGFARTGSGTTLGGGFVLDVAPPRRRRSDPALARDLAALARRDLETDVAVRVARAGLAGALRERLRRELGVEEEALADTLARVAGAGRLVIGTGGRCLSAEALADLEARTLAALAALHAREPLRPGFAASELATALPANVPADALALSLARLARAGKIEETPDGVRSVAHGSGLASADRALAERIRGEARAAGLEPPNLKEWCELLAAPPEKLRGLLGRLAREGVLVAAPDDFWFDRAAVDALRARVVEHLRAHRELETPAYKTLIGTTRKHAVPLMELFDRERVTLRVGNKRVLRGGRS